MALVYLWNGATGLADGSDFTNAYTTLLAAAGGAVASDTILTASDHTEDPGATTLYTFPGSISNPMQIISVNRTTEIYERGANIYNTLGVLRFRHYYVFEGFDLGSDSGINWNYGGTTNVGVVKDCKYDDALLIVGGFVVGGGYLRLENYDYTGDDTNTISGTISMNAAGVIEWFGGKWDVPGGISEVVRAHNTLSCIHFEGVDLSNTGITNYIGQGSIFKSGVFKFVSCSLNSTATMSYGSLGRLGLEFHAIDCDDGAGNKLYNFYHQNYGGELLTSDVVYRTGGGRDDETNISWKINTDIDAHRDTPFISEPIEFWIDSTGAKTVTLEFAHDSLTDLTDGDIGVQLTYLGSAASTQATVEEDVVILKGTPVARTTSTETWVNSFTNENKQKITVNATVNRIGPISLRVMVYKPSYTVYACPKIEVA